MNVTIKTELDLEVSQIAAACSPEEVGSIFSECANVLAEKHSGEQAKRRLIVYQITQGLSENAKRMLAEVLALEFAKLNR